MCEPCSISYNAVLKLETIGPDASWFFSHLNLTDRWAAWQQVVGSSGSSAHVGPAGLGGQTSASLTKQYLQQVRPEKIRQLYAKYRLDFDMFNYSIDEFL